MIPNDQQKIVINHVDGPCLVTAVPGSGKTATITERVKNLILLGKDPSDMLAITFTNKAAKEMKDRISKTIGQDLSRKMTICTIHSLCSRILREYCMFVGLRKDYTIYDDDKQSRLLKSCAYKVLFPGQVDDPSKKKDKISQDSLMQMNKYIETKRNSCLSTEEAMRVTDIDSNEVKVCEFYFQELKRNNAIDFTGLLSETVRLFEENPKIREEYSSRYKYISVDEVQDTNKAQYKLIVLLGRDHRNILLTGDLDQSIYAFRDARPQNILAFEEDFKAKILKLEKNYRSTPQILSHSQKLIEHNKLRKETSLITDNKDGDDPKVSRLFRDIDMTDAIADYVLQLKSIGVPPNEIAILFRVAYLSRGIEMSLRAKGIKYKVIGGLMSFWKRKEIKSSIAILNMFLNPSDTMSFETVVESCCLGVGPKTLSTISKFSEENKIDILSAANEFCSRGSAAAKGLSVLMNSLSESKDMRQDHRLLKIAQDTHLWEWLEKDSTQDNDRCANVTELANDLGRSLGTGVSFQKYLEMLSLASDSDEVAKEEEIKLMTFHGCKGLEFDSVILSFANHGIIPHSRTLELPMGDKRDFQIEEERRLFYVGMTRARKYLKIFYCSRKTDRGGDLKPLSPSMFIKEAGF